MKRLTLMVAAGTFALLVGCGSDGIIFNGEAQVEQFPIRTTPIVHYQLPSEEIDPVTGKANLVFSFYQNISSGTFVQYASPGHDLWAMLMTTFHCSDNPTCRGGAAPLPDLTDWEYIFADNYPGHPIRYEAVGQTGQAWPPGGSFPHPQIAGAPTPIIAGWTMSIMNQWFLKEVDGSPKPPKGTPENPEAPVLYESVEFSSMAISIHENAARVDGVTPLLSNNPPSAAQQETEPTGLGEGANGQPRVIPNTNNYLSWGFDGNDAPAGLLAMGWREAPAQNIHIETNASAFGPAKISMQGVPVPDYFGGGGPVSGGGGVFTRRYVDIWWNTTDGNSNVPKDNGLLFSYYLAVVGNHIIGYGLGLIDSSFASPDAVNNQEDIMTLAVTLDMTAFIASGKEFQFSTEDLLRMQDTVNGTWQEPHPTRSTLPGRHRG
jgi:hypothetical protein